MQREYRDTGRRNNRGRETNGQTDRARQTYCRQRGGQIGRQRKTFREEYRLTEYEIQRPREHQRLSMRDRAREHKRQREREHERQRESMREREHERQSQSKRDSDRERARETRDRSADLHA